MFGTIRCVDESPYSGEVLHSQLVQRDVLRLCLEDGPARESVGLSEGQLEHNRGQRELNQAPLTRSFPTRPLFYTTRTEQLLLPGRGGQQ